MADRTPFAGFTRLSPGDPLSADGYGLQFRNPALLDYFLRLIFTGARDGHDALTDPALDPVPAIVAGGGQIPADMSITVGYTLTDADGGETALSPLIVVQTRVGLQSPDSAPVLALDNIAGTLLAGSYDYAVTLTDGLGGETMLGPVATVLIPSGNPANEIVVSGLDALVAAQGAAGWRLWRSISGEDFHLIGQGVAATFTDDGSHAADCGVIPPTSEGTTNADSKLNVTVPAGQPAEAVGFNIYATTTGAFDQPSLLGTYPVADLGVLKTYLSLAFLAQTPPESSTTMDALPGGGGGLFAYPQTWDTGSLDTTDFAGGAGGSTRRQEPKLALGIRTGGVPRTFLYDGPGEWEWSDAIKFLTSSSGANPGWAENVYFFDADAPGMLDGDATVKFRMPVFDADTNGAVFALIGHQFGPRIYTRAFVHGTDGTVEFSVGIREDSDDSSDEIATAAGAAGTVAAATDYWLRVRRQGVQIGGDLFSEDPALNPAAVPLVTIPLTNMPPYDHIYDWDFRTNSMPGFGWEYSDNADRNGVLVISGLKSHATSGGDGYKPMPGQPLMRIQTEGNDEGIFPSLNFVNFNVSNERPDRDRFTIALPGLRTKSLADFNFANALDPLYGGFVATNMALYVSGGQYLGVKASAAGADGTLVPDATYGTRNADSQLTRVMLVGAAADDKYAVRVRVIDANNFLEARVDNGTAAPKLQLVVVDAGVETVIGSLDITQHLADDVLQPWDVPNPLWLEVEYLPGNSSLGAALYTMDPNLESAHPEHFIGKRVVGTARDKFQFFPVAPFPGYGLQLQPAAGGANTLRASQLELKGT